MGFLAAGVPFGVSVAFWVSSPLISEIAAIMLLSMGSFGVYIVSIYLISGTIISVLAGYLADKFHIEKYLALNIPKTTPPMCACSSMREKAVALIKYAHGFSWSLVKSLYLYILVGLIISAYMHGYIPKNFL